METLEIKKLDKTFTQLNQKEMEILKTQLEGEILTPQDSGYDEARALYNAMIDKKPAIIARCKNADDVIASVNFARDKNLLLAVRGGGHSFPGLSSCDGGFVIDLSPMKNIQVDAENRTARVEAGCTWGEVDSTTNGFGLATVSGIIANTGVAGLTLGGGHGHLSRKYGLTIDNLLEAEVVLVDGSFVTANKNENEDLFWALRGGGGNFGVATSFKYQLHPVDTIIGGPTLWPIEQTEEVLSWYRNFLPNAPHDLNGFFAFLQVPPVPNFPEELHLKKMCGVVWCYTGPKEKADEVFAPVHKVGKPALHGVQEMPYPALQSAFDALIPPGLQWYLKGDFVRGLSDEAVKLHVEHGTAFPTMLSTMHLYPIDGAVQRVAKEDTAWSYRDVTWSAVFSGTSENPDDNELITQWVKDYWAALHPYSAGAGYVNFMMGDSEERIRATYGDNYDRLVEIKTKYDPDNLFRVNQNIKPKSGR